MEEQEIEQFEDDKRKVIVSTKLLSKIQKRVLEGAKVKDSDFISIRYNRLSAVMLKKLPKNFIITSKNGLQALMHNFEKKDVSFDNIYCVGRVTKKHIEQALGNVTFKAKTAKDLAEHLLTTDIKEFTYFCGDIRRDELPEILAKHNIRLEEVEIYKTILSATVVKPPIDGIMFYSPSGVESYLKENPETVGVAFCIGNTTAKAASESFDKVLVSKISTVQSVLELVKDHFDIEPPIHSYEDEQN